MKKILCAVLALTLALSLAACGGASAPAEPKDYVQIIADTRTGDDAEIEIVTTPEEDTFGMMELYGLDPAWMERYAVSISPINMRAYGVMIVLPTEEGREDAKAAMQGFIQQQAATFESYLPDQFAIAEAAQLVDGAGGELVLVMCEDSDAVTEQILKALK